MIHSTTKITAINRIVIILAIGASLALVMISRNQLISRNTPDASEESFQVPKTPEKPVYKYPDSIRGPIESGVFAARMVFEAKVIDVYPARSMSESGLISTPAPIAYSNGRAIYLHNNSSASLYYRPIALEVIRYFRNTCNNTAGGLTTYQMTKIPISGASSGETVTMSVGEVVVGDKIVVLNDGCDLSAPDGISYIDYLKDLSLKKSTRNRNYRFVHPGQWYIVRNGQVFRDGQQIESESEIRSLLNKLEVD